MPCLNSLISYWRHSYRFYKVFAFDFDWEIFSWTKWKVCISKLHLYFIIWKGPFYTWSVNRAILNMNTWSLRLSALNPFLRHSKSSRVYWRFVRIKRSDCSRDLMSLICREHLVFTFDRILHLVPASCFTDTFLLLNLLAWMDSCCFLFWFSKWKWKINYLLGF